MKVSAASFLCSFVNVCMSESVHLFAVDEMCFSALCYFKVSFAV